MSFVVQGTEKRVWAGSEVECAAWWLGGRFRRANDTTRAHAHAQWVAGGFVVVPRSTDPAKRFLRRFPSCIPARKEKNALKENA